MIHQSHYWASVQLSSVQLLSRVRLFATPWIVARQASLSITNFQSSPKLMSIESVMPSSHFILCHPVLLLPPIPPGIRVFSLRSWTPYCQIQTTGIHPDKPKIQKDTCTPMFIVALFTIAKTWKQPRGSSTDERGKMWCICTRKYSSPMEKNETMTFSAIWMNLGTMIQSKLERERRIQYDITYIWNLKHKWT